MIDIERALGGMVRCKKNSSNEGVRGWEGSSGAVGVGWFRQSQSRGTARGGVKRLPLGGVGVALRREARACAGRARKASSGRGGERAGETHCIEVSAASPTQAWSSD